MRFPILVAVFTAVLMLAIHDRADAFCGFYVAKADASLFNQASQVILTREINRESGRSVARVNGRAVNSATLREVGGRRGREGEA
mgnify:CR=1 FL=1